MPRDLGWSPAPSPFGGAFGGWPRSAGRSEELRAEVAAFERLLGNVVAALEARAPGTLRHGERVARISEAIGRRLGVSVESLDRMRRGAILHDIGNLVLPERLLSKRGRGENGQRDLVDAHPVLGYALLRGVSWLEPILPFVHRHHERIDGSGFPDGLSGTEIPLAVQIVSLADAYDELAAGWPRRRRRTREEALEALAEEARLGRWDPNLLGPLRMATGGRRGAVRTPARERRVTTRGTGSTGAPRATRTRPG